MAALRPAIITEHCNAYHHIRGGLNPGIWLVLALVAACAGCVSHDSTTAERATSFAPYVNAHIGQATVAEYIEQRTAPLTVNTFGHVSMVGSGYATAIDRRGYYLTAAHCVQFDKVELLLGHYPDFILAEVVWSGVPNKEGSDLAIIFVDSPPAKVFEWATEFGKGDVVFGIGPNADSPDILSTLLTKPISTDTSGDMLGGKILELPSKPAMPLRASEFIHDMPLHPGDSGGPMVTADGRLIAINCVVFNYPFVRLLDPIGLLLGGRPVTTRPQSAAYRPDLAWLGRIINADSAMRTAEAKGDVDGAIMAAGLVLDFDPNNVAALNQRGQLEGRKSDLVAAIADYDRAIAIAPANFAAHYNRGIAENHNHHYDLAIADFTAALAIDQMDIGALVNRGDAYLSKGDFHNAIYDETRALMMEPKARDLFVNRVVTQFSSDDFVRVIADFTRAIELWPKNANYLLIRGNAKLALDDHQGATSDFEAAINLEPKNSQALFLLGAEQKIGGNLKGALADWEQSIAADSANSNHTRLYRALLLAQRGQPDAGFAQDVADWKDGSLKAMGLFVAGRTDETALLTAAGKATDQPVLDAQCEADYCIGVMRLVGGDVAGAREFFQKSVATSQKSRLALIFARAELTHLGPNAVPPAQSSP